MNKLKSASILLANLLLLSACGSTPQPLVRPAAPSAMVLQPVANTPVNNPVVADMGHGSKTPAKLSFSINLSDLDKFSIKASTAGTAAKTKADLTNLKFYLIESDTGTPPTALAGSGFTYTVSATNRTNNRVDITFTNVASSNTGKSYYIAAAGFSSSTYTAANNITNLNAPIDDSTEGLYYVSNSGGSPAGAVRVTPVTYAISGSSALAVPLKLLDAVTPIVDSDVNITAGDDISGAPVGSGG